jgi:hypothetical protein
MRDMKTLSQILGLALIASSLAACGSSNNSAGAALAAQQAAAAANGIQTAAGGCIQLGAPLPFTANGAAIDSTKILAGNFPASSGIQQFFGQLGFGQVVMGGGLNTTGSSIQYQPLVSSSGQLQLSVNGTSVSGVIQLGQSIVSYIQGSSGNTYNPSGTVGVNNTAGLCVNSLSLWAIQTVLSSGNQGGQYGQQYGQSMGTGQINQAIVYLTMNNGQSVGPITFKPGQ